MIKRKMNQQHFQSFYLFVSNQRRQTVCVSASGSFTVSPFLFILLSFFHWIFLSFGESIGQIQTSNCSVMLHDVLKNQRRLRLNFSPSDFNLESWEPGRSKLLPADKSQISLFSCSEEVVFELQRNWDLFFLRAAFVPLMQIDSGRSFVFAWATAEDKRWRWNLWFCVTERKFQFETVKFSTLRRFLMKIHILFNTSASRPTETTPGHMTAVSLSHIHGSFCFLCLFLFFSSGSSHFSLSEAPRQQLTSQFSCRQWTCRLCQTADSSLMLQSSVFFSADQHWNGIRSALTQSSGTIKPAE